MLVFAGITAHPPMLLPPIASDETMHILEQSKMGFEQLEQSLYLSKPDLIIVISPHQKLFPHSFVINAHDQFFSDYRELGDISLKESWPGTPELAAKIAYSSRSSLPVRLVSEEAITYATTVPLHFLTQNFSQIRILPIGISDASREDHLTFGRNIREEIDASPKRIAVIASGDLSHTLTDDAPNGYDEQGAQLDTQLMKALQEADTTAICHIDDTIVQASHNCGYLPIVTLLGIIEDMYTKTTIYSYEHPFGIGYLNAECILE